MLALPPCSVPETQTEGKNVTMDPLAGLTRKQREYVESVERYTKGLTAVSTGVCPGCEQCRDEYGVKVRCECQDAPENEGEPNPDCDDCDGHGKRPPTMAEFDEQCSNGSAFSEGSFSWRGCGICGSTLGGTVEPWHYLNEHGEIVHCDDACVDCVCYLANGDLPG